MKNKGCLITCFFLFVSMGFLSASVTEDLLSEDVSSLQITIGEHSSQADFYFNSEGKDWDKFSIQEGSVQINNLYLSDLLSSLNFKIENNEKIQFTTLSIEEPSTLQAVIDNYLTLEDYNFFVEDINGNLSLINEFVELDNSEFYQSLQKSGNNYVYKIDKGWADVNIEEIVEEATQVFYFSNILSEVGIEDIIDLNFSIELQGLNNVSQKNGEYNLNLKFIDGENVYNKNIKLILIGYVEPVIKKGSGSHNDEGKAPAPKVFLIGKQSIENGYSQILSKGESMEFTLAEKHSIQVLEIYKNNQIKLKIQSDPIYAYMTEGQERTFNISENEVLTIEVVELNEDNVEINVKGQVLVLPEEEIDLSSENQKGRGFFRLTGNVIGDFVKSDSALPVGLGIIFVALILVLVGVLRKRK